MIKEFVGKQIDVLKSCLPISYPIPFEWAAQYFREEFEEDDSEVEDSEEEQEDMEDYKKGDPSFISSYLTLFLVFPSILIHIFTDSVQLSHSYDNIRIRRLSSGQDIRCLQQ